MISAALDINRRMNDLRDLLYTSPGTEVFQAICRLLHDWPSDGDLDVAINYSDQLLARWPDTTRKALGSWRHTHATGYARLWPLVRALEIYYEGLGDQGVVKLCARPQMAHITHLGLQLNHIGDHGAMTLAATPHLERLTCLDLSVNHIGDAGICALINSPWLGQLKSLNLQKNRLTREGARVLAETPALARLEELRLAGNPVAYDDHEPLSRSPFLKDHARANLFVKA